MYDVGITYSSDVTIDYNSFYQAYWILPSTPIPLPRHHTLIMQHCHEMHTAYLTTPSAPLPMTMQGQQPEQVSRAAPKQVAPHLDSMLC
jgi:hypothetical protein